MSYILSMTIDNNHNGVIIFEFGTMIRKCNQSLQVQALIIEV